MSNYIFGFIKKTSRITKDNISDVFFENVYFEDFPTGFFFRVSQDNTDQSSYTRGIKIDKIYKDIIFTGGEQAGRIHAFLDGSYIDQDIHDYLLSISTDKFGLYNVLYTSCDDGFFISDSLLVLVELRRLASYKNTLNRDEFIARSWMNAITYSLISEETSIKEVKYLLPGYRLNINLLNCTISVEKGCDLITLNNCNKTYYETVQDEAAHLIGILKELADYYDLSMSVSGGLDSRVLLAASYLLTNIYPCKNHAYVNCNSKANLEDYNVVTNIANKYSLPFNVEPYKRNSTIKVSKGLQWAISSLGLYDPIYSVGYYKNDPNTIFVGGHSAEVFKGNYGWRSVKSIAKDIRGEEKADFFTSQINKNNYRIDLDQYENISSELLYLYFRSAIHGSRFKLISLLTIRPLLINSFINISYTTFKMGRAINPNKLSQDLALALSPSIACEDYDNSQKNIDLNHREETLANFDPNHAKLYKYTIQGSSASITNKPISFSLRVAEKRFFDSNDFNSILKYHLPYIDNVAEIYDIVHIVNDLKNNITDIENKSVKEGAAIGKLLLLSVVD